MSLIGEGPEYQRYVLQRQSVSLELLTVVVTPLLLVRHLCFLREFVEMIVTNKLFFVVFWYEEMSRGLFHTLKDELRSN